MQGALVSHWCAAANYETRFWVQLCRRAVKVKADRGVHRAPAV